MPTHPVFRDLLLHSDDELARLLGAGVVRRDTIHAWPLSCVQAVSLDDGRKLAYKAQLPPTVEPEFYATASGRLLTGHRSLGRLGGEVRTMALDWIDAPLLGEVAGEDQAELVWHGRRIVDDIARLGGDLPVYLDIGSRAAWSAVADGVLARWAALVAEGWFVRTGQQAVARIRDWAASAPVLAAVGGRARVAHGDLTAHQVFVTPDGYRVVDWQRPVLAPPEVDLAALLTDRGVDPRPWVGGEVTGVYWFLRLHWAVEAQSVLFPGRRSALFDDWAHEAVTNILH